MLTQWNQLTEDLQISIAQEALHRATAAIAAKAEVLADEIENGAVADCGGPDALRLFAAVMRVSTAADWAPEGHA